MARKVAVASVSSSDSVRDKADEQFEMQRKVLFECIRVGSDKITRFEAFVQAENRRRAQLNELALRNVKTLSEMVDQICADEEDIRRNPQGIAASRQENKLLQRLFVDILGPVAVAVSYKIAKEIRGILGAGQKVQLICPYYIDEKDWRRLETSLNKAMCGDSKGDYKVGHGKPPIETRFKGSGNPAGRPRAEQCVFKRIKGRFDAPVKVRAANGNERSMPQAEFVLRQTWQRAMDGNSAARKNLMEEITKLYSRKLLVPLPTKRRRRRHKKPIEQEAVDKFRVIAFKYAAEVEVELRAAYDCRYGTSTGRQGEIVDYEAGVNIEAETTINNGDEKDEQKKCLPKPGKPRARRPVVPRCEATNKGEETIKERGTRDAKK